MRTSARFLFVGILVIVLLPWSVNTGMEGIGAAQTPPSQPAVGLAVVSYPALVDQIRGQRGHVVVVDVWGEF